MPVRKATLEETRAWLGGGLVMPARKPQQTTEESTAPPVEPDQLEYDRLMAQQTPEQYKAMVKGLGALARSKLMSEPNSSSATSKPWSKSE